MRILVADDEELCRNLLRDMFIAEPNVELTMAEDGAEAWWLLTVPKSRYDLVIVDLKMPKVDGLQFIERVRASVALRHLPVILCTGISDRDTVGRAAKLAINHYVVKPFKAEALRDKIRLFMPRNDGVERTLLSA